MGILISHLLLALDGGSFDRFCCCSCRRRRSTNGSFGTLTPSSSPSADDIGRARGRGARSALGGSTIGGTTSGERTASSSAKAGGWPNAGGGTPLSDGSSTMKLPDSRKGGDILPFSFGDSSCPSYGCRKSDWGISWKGGGLNELVDDDDSCCGLKCCR